MNINILLPVLNEELRLEDGVVKSVKYFEKNFSGQYEINIMDNGSTDKTEAISRKLEKRFNSVHYNKLNQRGVGLALREGIIENKCDIVGYFDVDLSTDMDYILKMYNIFLEYPEIGIVNGTRNSVGSKVIGRKFIRTITSHGLKMILHLLLGSQINDALCGFKFFRKDVANMLVKKASQINGWFYCGELLLRAEKYGIKICELPVTWTDDYNSKVNIPKLIFEYMQQIFKLFYEFKIK